MNQNCAAKPYQKAACSFIDLQMPYKLSDKVTVWVNNDVKCLHLSRADPTWPHKQSINTYGADAWVLVHISTVSAQTTCMHCHEVLYTQCTCRHECSQAREQSGCVPNYCVWLRLDSVCQDSLFTAQFHCQHLYLHCIDPSFKLQEDLLRADLSSVGSGTHHNGFQGKQLKTINSEQKFLLKILKLLSLRILHCACAAFTSACNLRKIRVTDTNTRTDYVPYAISAQHRGIVK